MMNTKFKKSARPSVGVAMSRGARNDSRWGNDVCASPFVGGGGVSARSCAGTAPGGALPIWKRGIDLLFILLSLPVLIPLVVSVILWIKLVSRGSVLFRQDRVGRYGRRFLLYKFRSMRERSGTTRHENHFQELVESDCPMVKLDELGDQRLIPGGAIFRTLGLDELPQLINVIRGEMSIVGPRPCLPKEYNLYEPEQRERFNAVPGLTGYWQVNGKNRTKFSEMIDMDIHYSRNMSPGLDLEIMFKTVPAILHQAVDCYSKKHGSSDPDRRT